MREFGKVGLFFLLWGLVIGVLASMAMADAGEVQSLIDAGKFKEAVEAGTKLGTSEGYSLASKAAAYFAIYLASTDDEKRDWFRQAESLARRAIELDPKNPQAYMALGRALGRLAEYANLFSQVSLGLQIRQAFEKAISLDPSYPEPKVGLALWHAELTAKGVGFLFGAQARRVEPLMEEALRLQPNRIIFHVEYARAMLALGRKDKAKTLLERALSLPVRTAEDRFEQERARALLREVR
ncbi:tetratricopeptide repeat protein [Thermus antranikianii]